jgi:hypothetical protein
MKKETLEFYLAESSRWTLHWKERALAAEAELKKHYPMYVNEQHKPDPDICVPDCLGPHTEYHGPEGNEGYCYCGKFKCTKM